jgi:antitoxin CptB
MNSNKQNLINKIIYRSQYRGTKEMDIFVSGFVKSIIDSLSIDDLKDLDTLVNMSDEDISKISKNEMSFENNKLSRLLIDFK